MSKQFQDLENYIQDTAIEPFTCAIRISVLQISLIKSTFHQTGPGNPKGLLVIE